MREQLVIYHQQELVQLSPRWMKVLRDLWVTRTRTLLVVLSIAVGVFAFGMIAAAQVTIQRDLRIAYRATNPASATIVTTRFESTLVDAIQRLPLVGAAQGRRIVKARMLIGDSEWYDLRMVVLPDEQPMQVSIVQPETGIWPPAKDTLLMEYLSLPELPFQVGDTLIIELGDGTRHALHLAGSVRDMSTQPANDTGQAYGYISLDTLESLGLERFYDQLQFVTAEQPDNIAHIQHVVDEVSNVIKRSGRTVEVVTVPNPPQKHPADDFLPSIFLILQMMSVLVLVIGGFLINNTVGATLTQQIKQIGIMKAIGARSGQIMWLYLSMVLIYGLLSLILAIPLAILGAQGFSGFLADQLNFEIADFTMPPQILLLQVVAALLVPALTALPTIRTAVRITIHEAISSEAGVGAGFKPAPTPGKSLVDRLIERLRRVPRPLLLSLRNTFRRKARLITTLTALTLSGAMFGSVLIVRDSLYRTLDEAIAARHYDIEVELSRSYRLEQLLNEAHRVPGVVSVEGGRAELVYPIRPDGSEGQEITMHALPAGSTLLQSRMRTGRWLLPADDHAIVLSSNFLLKMPGMQVGDELTLKRENETATSTWRIVGFSEDFISPLSPAIAYVHQEAFVRAFGGIGQIDSLRITTTEHNPSFQEQVAQNLDLHFDAVNIHLQVIKTTNADRERLGEQFDLLTVILLMMAMLIGLVGGLGLMGTMSINVLERTREIGIMRAIGASDRIIQSIVIVEGLVIGLMAWVTGTLLSLPASRVLSDQLGRSLLNTPLSYSYATSGIIIWLVLVLSIAAIASYLPARNASRLTIREVLAYE